MKIALAQLDIEWESKAANLRKAESFIRKASQKSCDIVVFPEMFSTGFSMNIPSVAEDAGGEAALALSSMAKEYSLNIIAGISFKELTEKKARNSAIICDRQGRLIARFTKLHPFSYVKEDEYYLPGSNVVTFRIEGIQASVFICYDLRFPEVFRMVAKEVQVVFVIANWPTARKNHWETLLKARAIENQCFVIGVNRTGEDGNGLRYAGASHIFDPTGNSICSGGEKEELLIGEIDPDEVVKVRSEFPFLKDMRF